MKKIIIATDTWHPHIDGVIRTIDELSIRLKGKDFEVIVLHPALFLNLPLFFYSDYKIALFPGFKIKKIIERENPDYVHIATWGPVGMATRSVCLKAGLNFTSFYPTHFPLYAKNYIFKSDFIYKTVYKILKWFHNAGNATMVSTESLKKEAENHGFKNVKILPLAVDNDFFKNSGKDVFSSQLQKPFFIYFGRIAKEKNVESFLQCNLPRTIIVIGDGPQKKYFEKKYKNCVFLGWKKGKELVDCISSSDVFVFPSKTDTFGLTILEALSCGVPVAAYDVMGPKDIIASGYDGFLSQDIQQAAINCLSLNKTARREKALLYSWEKSTEIFINNIVKVR